MKIHCRKYSTRNLFFFILFSLIIPSSHYPKTFSPSVSIISLIKIWMKVRSFLHHVYMKLISSFLILSLKKVFKKIMMKLHYWKGWEKKQHSRRRRERKREENFDSWFFSLKNFFSSWNNNMEEEFGENKWNNLWMKCGERRECKQHERRVGEKRGSCIWGEGWGCFIKKGLEKNGLTEWKN